MDDYALDTLHSPLRLQEYRITTVTAKTINPPTIAMIAR
jgi:hypothetical protein